jgi:molybdopterin synthase catalytic subunit/GNAT superfamily N-acetyltransferase
MTIRLLHESDRAEWRRMRGTLWHEYPEQEIDGEIDQFFRFRSQRRSEVFVAERPGGALGGFIEVGQRIFADGCGTSPVGYLEGWYVDEDLRRQGIGAALVEAAEQWAISRGCTEMGSDCNSMNRVSYDAHLRLGYAPADRHIFFRKPIGEPVRFDKDWIAIVPHDLLVGTAVRLVTAAGAGGIDVFLGTTRAETSPEGPALLALDYEAYEEMALEKMNALAEQARSRWPIVRIAFLHRIGRVPVGEPSVIIAVATPHRAESFDACRFLIEQLKVDVPIWKQEVWDDGKTSWK